MSICHTWESKSGRLHLHSNFRNVKAYKGTRTEVCPVFLGTFLGPRKSAIGQFFHTTLVTIPEVIAKVMSDQFSPRFQGLYDPTTRWQRIRRLKSEFTFFQFLSRLFLLIYFIKSRQTPLELNSNDPYLSSENETKFRRRLFTSFIKYKIKQF